MESAVKPELLWRHRRHLVTLKGCIGRRVVAIHRTRYLLNGQPNEIGHGDVEICFEGGLIVVLSLAADGESVKAKSGSLTALPRVDLVDGAFWATEVLCVSDAEPFSNFVGAVLSSVDAVIDRTTAGEYDTLSGWALHFEDRLLTFVNMGAESRLALDVPPSHSGLTTSLEDIGAAGDGAS